MGPAVRAAILCERVLTEIDGVVSAVRIIAQAVVAPGAQYDATLLLVLANIGAPAPGDHAVLMRVESDAGAVLGRAAFPIAPSRAPDGAFNVIVPLAVRAPDEATTIWLCFAYAVLATGDAAELARIPVFVLPTA